MLPRQRIAFFMCIFSCFAGCSPEKQTNFFRSALKDGQNGYIFLQRTTQQGGNAAARNPQTNRNSVF
jgi:hypothetical protein